ncbi:hypothetical protein GQ607_017182, partial [Colletotrichum asianum]
FCSVPVFSLVCFLVFSRWLAGWLAGWLANWPGHLSVSGCQIVRYQIPTCSLHGTTHNHNRRVSGSLHITKYQTRSITRIVLEKDPRPPQIPPRNRMTPRPRLPPASPGVPPVTRIFGAEGDDPTLSSSLFARIARHPGSAPKNEATTYSHPVLSRLTRCGAGRCSVAGDHTQISQNPDHRVAICNTRRGFAPNRRRTVQFRPPAP